jgi:hypothetical protein
LQTFIDAGRRLRVQRTGAILPLTNQTLSSSIDNAPEHGEGEYRFENLHKKPI